MDEKFSRTITMLVDRTSTTQELIKPIPVTESEDTFLKMATQQQETWASTTVTFYSSKLLEAALAKHSEALVRSAEASDKHAASLTWATWILALATIFLVLATAALIFYE